MHRPHILRLRIDPEPYTDVFILWKIVAHVSSSRINKIYAVHIALVGTIATGN